MQEREPDEEVAGVDHLAREVHRGEVEAQERLDRQGDRDQQGQREPDVLEPIHPAAPVAGEVVAHDAAAWAEHALHEQ